MNPLEASSLLATLVGLICNWKQERASQATDRFQDFMTWLANHHHDQLRDRIFASDELQRELHSLLQQDLSVLGSKLDTLAGAISAVANKIDSLSQIGRAVGADIEALSDQAVALLKAFEQSGDGRIIVFGQELGCRFTPSGGSFTVVEPRFLEADVEALAELGFVELVDQNRSGCPIYALTRSGSRFALSFSNELEYT